MGKSTISIAIFNSYISLPEGTPLLLGSTKGTNMNQLQWGKSPVTLRYTPLFNMYIKIYVLYIYIYNLKNYIILN